MTTDAKRLQDQMQAGKFAHTDPHRGTCDDCGARLTVPNTLESTRSGFTDRRESDETAESVSVGADAGERRTEPLSGIPIPLDHDRTEFRMLTPESTPGDSAGAESVVEQVAQMLSGNVYGPSAAIEKCRRLAQALADAGLLADPAATEHRLVCDQCHATKATLRAAQADRNQWKRAAEITGEEIGRWRQSLITVEGERDRARDLADHRGARVADLEAELETWRGKHAYISNVRDDAWTSMYAAEARARRAEDALRRMTATARCVLGDNRIESDADLGNYPDPNLAELWLDVKHADRALAGQTSDATPSDGGDQ